MAFLLESLSACFPSTLPWSRSRSLAIAPDPGHYQPTPNEVLVGRYEVRAKLETGAGFSTWLVKDFEAAQTPRFLAVKILTLDATQDHVERARIQRELECDMKIQGSGLPASHLHSYVDVLHIPSSWGQTHLGLVTEFFEKPVASLQDSSPNKTLPVHTVKHITKQVLQATATLHALDIIHTDITSDNVLIHSGLDGKSIDECVHALPSDRNEKKYPFLESFNWDASPEEAMRVKVSLAGLGQCQSVGSSTLLGNCTVTLFSAFQLRAPEVILRGNFGTAIDTWAIGCLVFDMLVGRWLFHPEEGDDWTLEDDHLARMMELTGERFSYSQLEASELRYRYFDDQGNLTRISNLLWTPLEDALSRYNVLPKEEVIPAASFIRECIRLDPAERSTAAALLLHPWLRDIHSSRFRQPCHALI
ncbi:kinase-like protein [Phanerochaete sordida]|uniref:non-specific serine/threonine protein kinase n=1 Tax=Phanerochaete sordida TaxID=48140 RepID=A0A9P3LDC8_9APHY|nr:kinase-like protein [Phanerochaete sordida]